MRLNLILSVLVVSFAASLASAQETDESQATAATPVDMTGLLTADSITGSEIFSFTRDQETSFWDSGEQFDVLTTDWEAIGEVQNVVLDRGGRVVGLTTDVGGFLGIGSRSVLLMLEDIRLIASDDDRLVVATRLTRAQIEQLDELTGVLGHD